MQIYFENYESYCIMLLNWFGHSKPNIIKSGVNRSKIVVRQQKSKEKFSIYVMTMAFEITKTWSPSKSKFIIIINHFADQSLFFSHPFSLVAFIGLVQDLIEYHISLIPHQCAIFHFTMYFISRFSYTKSTFDSTQYSMISRGYIRYAQCLLFKE